MMLSGRMGRFDDRLNIILAELDDITDNRYFQKRFSNTRVIDGVNHYLGEDGALKIIKHDLSS